MAPSCTVGAVGRSGVKGESAGKAEEQETRLFSNLPSKTSRGRGPRASELRFVVYHPNQRYLEKRGCLFSLSPWPHLWLTEARGLNLGFSAAHRPSRKAAAFRVKREGEVGAEGVQGRRRQTPPKASGCRWLQAISLA